LKAGSQSRAWYAGEESEGFSSTQFHAPNNNMHSAAYFKRQLLRLGIGLRRIALTNVEALECAKRVLNCDADARLHLSLQTSDHSHWYAMQAVYTSKYYTPIVKGSIKVYQTCLFPAPCNAMISIAEIHDALLK
jgi:hypothetical protein